MKNLSNKALNNAEEAIKKFSRPLVKSIFQSEFYSGTTKKIIEELKKYQNEDGGFGNGLEPDFRLPNSSPMATSVGLRLLSDLDYLKEVKEMIKKAINYLEKTFDKDRMGWFAVPKEVNDYLHTPWWHYNEEEGMTVIDRNWGNPSAEIIAYLYKYREYIKTLDIDGLVKYGIDYIQNKEKFDSENEVFCYIKLYEVLPVSLQEELKEPIAKGINQTIVYDENRWYEYVPRPSDFVDDPNKFRFGIKESQIQKDLDYLIRELEDEGKILPPWGKSFYTDEFRDAYNHWIGILTLKALKKLQNHGRIE
ncbi:hypothetical protein GOQ27_08955 [Clostridium sp. D2Q-11]|uniref:Uncharacterized protein n=1 Tax=Anaeromonas frigoriresistens TaxID=2683708 RepID=A0A942UYD2_9FIRM|nr:hypothetical protein [Anaeromonas frigoriresistens]MBS4538591.1 hypothetical protein [Anaeromonas frigoriresistens]